MLSKRARVSAATQGAGEIIADLRNAAGVYPSGLELSLPPGDEAPPEARQYSSS